jgi:fatty-acyl-CoA synthase
MSGRALSTVTDRINSAQYDGREIVFLSRSGQVRLLMEEFVDLARQAAGRMQKMGVGPGAKVAILGPTSPELVRAITGAWLAGATVIVMPLPMRLGSLEAFVDATRRRIRATDPALVLVSGELRDTVTVEPGDPQPVDLADVISGPVSPYEIPRVSPEMMAVLQFTSGSTGDPRGVIVTHEMICANLDGAAQVAKLASDDRLMSWLPLYHDMGLIGVLCSSLIFGIDLVIGAPQDFLVRPREWLEAISTYKATISPAPNSAYALATKILEKSASSFDLSSWRIALNGAEPVDPDTFEAFIESGRQAGLSPGAAFCAYGLAEATIAGTFPEPGSGMSVDTVLADRLETDGIAQPAVGEEPRRRLAKLGRPVPSVELRVVDEKGQEVPERVVGEVELKGPAVTRGYYNDPQATAEAFDGPWFRTGDYGYIAEGELVICGRKKDVIIVAGRNIYPQDIERLVDKVPGVRPGNTVAFPVQGAKGRESFAVVAETKQPADASRIAADASKSVREFFGMAPADVLLVPSGTIPKTSSGKLQRSLTRSLYLEGKLPELARTG